MEELLRAIAEVDEEEDLLVRVFQAEWPDSSMRLIVEASTDAGGNVGKWSIRCIHLLEQRLRNRIGFSHELVDEHPTLWPFTFPSASAFFTGIPADVDACVGALYEAHEAAVGPWLSFGAALNRVSQVSELLRSGNGLLARGPVPLLKIYKKALLSRGVDVSIVGEYDLKFYDGVDHKAARGEKVQTLLIGDSYAVGIGWTAERV